MGHHIVHPMVGRACFKIPIGEPNIHGVVDGTCEAVGEQRIAHVHIHLAWQFYTVTILNRIMHSLGKRDHLFDLALIFQRVVENKVLRLSRLPNDRTLITVKRHGLHAHARRSHKQKDWGDFHNPLNLKNGGRKCEYKPHRN